ncbi:hypothetical protein F66182_5864 [Fusarium sp. NRRL 66182]|nr:hypothetical protein F66182_5864 [Fusarium sp. NRRL 66182]
MSSDGESTWIVKRISTLRYHWRRNILKYIILILALSSVIPHSNKPLILTVNRTIGQFCYITYLDSGLLRIPNDAYDLRFGNITRESPEIWDDHHQSFLRNAYPVPVHSHNDYWRRIPLFEALGSGCISVEADIWLRHDDLLVGHGSKGLDKKITLRSLYLDPLQRIFESQNAQSKDGSWRGVYNRAPNQTLVLLVDLKTSGSPDTFNELYDQLQPLRDLDYLTYWNGTDRIMRPLTVVATGSTDFKYVLDLNSTHRDIFWDAKLERLFDVGQDDFSTDPPTFKYNQSNSYYASTQFKNAILHPLPRNDEKWYTDNPQNVDIASSQPQQAEARGLLTRYWDTPTHPPNLKETTWRVLINSNVGVLNMDDLGTVRERAKGWGRLNQEEEL